MEDNKKRIVIKQQFANENEAKEKALDVLEHILNDYLTPSFGSMSKRDVDITLFMALQDLGIIDKTPKIYDVIQLLHVTRSKARNLIYECAVRRQEEKMLEEDLKRIIVEPIFLRDGDKVCIEVDNPLLIDYIRQRLKGLKHITDSSFNAELIKMTPDAFSELYLNLLEDGNIKEIEKKFVELGVKKDKSAKATVKRIIMSATKVALGKGGEALAEDVCDALGDWIKGVYDKIPMPGKEVPKIYEQVLEA